MRRRRPAVGIAFAADELFMRRVQARQLGKAGERRLQARCTHEGCVLLNARAEGTHWKCDHCAGVALL
eukprot:3426559-Pleurochrysis_carterae.AAC.1